MVPTSASKLMVEDQDGLLGFALDLDTNIICVDSEHV